MTGEDKFGFSKQEREEAIRKLAGVMVEPETSEPESPEPSFGAETELSENLYSTDQVIEAAKQSPDFLAGLAMPSIFKYLLPPVFIAIWNWLLSFTFAVRVFPQLAIGLPRGFGKTTIIKLYVLFCILFTNKKFILVISSTATLAENIISDIQDMLDEENIKKVFGDWRLGLETDRKDLKKFGFRGRNIILAGLGAGTSLRGLNLKNERPDVMIFEDIQTRECADSVVQSTALEQWMYGTAMKAKSPHGCMFIFVGNMYPTKNSILRKLKANPRWTKFIVGGILSSGESLWEDLQPLTQLLQEFENDLASGHPEIFYAEVLNDENASVNKILDLSKLPDYPYTEDEIPVASLIIIDPSNDKANSDAVSIGYFELLDAVPVAKEIIEARLSPGETIRTALELALRRNCKLIVVESNAFQYSLLYWFEYVCQQLQIVGMNCVDIYSGSLSKTTRILNMFKELTAGELYIHPSQRAAVHFQISQYNVLKRDNVDGILDLLSYAKRAFDTYIELAQLGNVIIQAEEVTEVPDEYVTNSF